MPFSAQTVVAPPSSRPMRGWRAWSVVACLCAAAPLVWAQSAITVTPGKAQARPVAQAWQAPPSAILKFQVQGKLKNIPYQTSARIDWRVQAQRYEASQEVSIPLAGSRRQSSSGKIASDGLQPEIFMDRGRREYSTTFDAASRSIRFSRGSESQPWRPGTQDRMSVFFQVAGMIAAAPQNYPPGTRITVQAASSRNVSPWTFIVGAEQALQLPAGAMQALQLEHVADDYLNSQLWLAPALQYLPVRILLREDQGRDELDLRLQSHTKP